MSEEKLKAKLDDMKKNGLVNFSFTPGDDFYKLTKDEKASVILETIAETEKYSAMSKEEKMQRDIEAVYRKLKILLNDLRKPLEEEQDITISRVRGTIDIALLVLGNWVKR